MLQTTKKSIDLESMYKENPRLACQKALQITRNLSGEERMQQINTLLHGYGTEAINGSWQNGYWCNIVAVYVNMGDTYAPTILQVRSDYGNGSNFTVCSYGDWIEKNQRKYDIQ